MAARLSAADIAHRTLVSTLFGVSVYGCYGIWAMHKERLRQGLVALAEHEEAEKMAKLHGGVKEDYLKEEYLKTGFVDPPPQRPS